MDTGLTPPASLSDVRCEGSGESFPRSILEGRRSALVLFAAGFYGKNDAFWIAEAGMRATCVDIDKERLRHMAKIYPLDWSFIDRDAFEYLDIAASWNICWDVVTVDCGAALFDQIADVLDAFCARARHAVVFGSDNLRVVVPPAGWKITDIRFRSNHAGGTYWCVVER